MRKVSSYWRLRAQECRAIADDMQDKDAKAAFNFSAESYDWLAKQQENALEFEKNISLKNIETIASDPLAASSSFSSPGKKSSGS